MRVSAAPGFRFDRRSERAVRLDPQGVRMYVFVRTDNPRPTFAADMTPQERAVMERHVAYWSEQARLGVAVVFGPVADPAGVYGIGVYRVQDEAHMQRLIDDDPANGLLGYHVFAMPRAVVGEAPGA